MHYRSKPCVATAKVRAVKCEIQISQNTIADVAKYYTNVWEGFKLEITGSVTRLGNLLDLGNFYSLWQQLICPIRQFLWSCQNPSFFKWNNSWATFIGIWRFFSGHTAWRPLFLLPINPHFHPSGTNVGPLTAALVKIKFGSSGQRAHRLLRWSEFKSRWILHFFVIKRSLERTENWLIKTKQVREEKWR